MLLHHYFLLSCQPDRKVLAIGADDVIQRQWHECCDLLAEAVISFHDEARQKIDLAEWTSQKRMAKTGLQA
jgi:hypothetical protein